MQQEKTAGRKESISMEEYLFRRQKIRENERNEWNPVFTEEKSPAWMRAELYV